MKSLNSNGWPGVERARQFAQQSLAFPPGHHYATLCQSSRTRQRALERGALVERLEPAAEGYYPDSVAQAVIPLEWCPTHNQMTRSHWRKKREYSRAIFSAILAQNGGRLTPVKGRPLVRFIRFASRWTDGDASWTKVPLDVLTTGRRGGGRFHLGVIQDDSEASIRLKAWQEPALLDCQFVLVDVWSEDG